MVSSLTFRLPRRSPPDRFICNTCGAVFLTAHGLVSHVEQYRDGGDGAA